MKRRTLTLVPAVLLMISAAAQAQPSTPSGMLLGIYAFPNWQGLRVTGTIPGYSAQGRMFRGDILKRVTADGMNVYPTRSLWQMEYAKDQIGPFRPAALEVFRPGIGTIYLWVEFQPIGGVAAYSTRGAAPTKMKAKIQTEQERPGARALFEGGLRRDNSGSGSNSGAGFPGADRQPSPPAPMPKPAGGAGSAASLFGR